MAPRPPVFYKFRTAAPIRHQENAAGFGIPCSQIAWEAKERRSLMLALLLACGTARAAE
jgi:hypothetical protein